MIKGLKDQKVSSEEKQRRELQKLLQAPGLKQQKGGEAITRIQNTLTAKMLGAAATPETPPSPPEPSKATGSSSHRWSPGVPLTTGDTTCVCMPSRPYQ